MKIIIFTLLLMIGGIFCKGQDTMRYSVSGSTNTHLLKMSDSISLYISSNEKNLLYRVVNIRLIFKNYEMKMLKTIGDTVINFPLKFYKNPVVTFKPGNFPMFKKAEAVTISSGEVIRKNKKGKTGTITNLLGREKDFQIVK